MISLRQLYCPAAAAIVLASLAAAPASAEVFATFETKRGFNPRRLYTFNATTEEFVVLPPGIALSENTNVFHPTRSPNGRYLAFLTISVTQRRVVMVDRTTGQFADLFTFSEAAADPPNSPTFSQDGTKVITGRRLDRRDASSPPGALQASFTHTDVTSFPTGPFPHQIVTAGGLDSSSPGRTVQPTPFAATSFAFGIEYDIFGPLGRVTVQQASGTTTLADPAAALTNPTISQSAGVVVYESAPAATQLDRKLVSRPLAGIATAPTTALPPLVNKPNQVTTHPAFSRDGRYLAFMRFTTGTPQLTNPDLFVWDRLTQLLLNPDGVCCVREGPARRESGIVLEVTPVFLTAGLAPGVVTFSLATASQVGIIVQRIVGTTRVLGRRAPKLRMVGRVPLGTFKKDRKHRVRWDRTVGGRRLPPGRYLVTLRSVTRRGQVRDLAKPVRVQIR